MASGAFLSLAAAVDEVPHLLSVSAAAIGKPKDKTAWSRVIGRAAVVLLSSHFERYFYAVNEEATELLNTGGILSERVPEALRLLHSKSMGDRLGSTSWEHRAEVLAEFISDEAWLWTAGRQGALDAGRFLEWMPSPKPANLLRYYRYWGVSDIFSAVTRKPHTRSRLWLLVSELVDKRNAIAHGDFSAQATRTDVKRYSSTVEEFCDRADRIMSKQLAVLLGAPRPW